MLPLHFKTIDNGIDDIFTDAFLTSGSNSVSIGSGHIFNTESPLVNVVPPFIQRETVNGKTKMEATCLKRARAAQISN